MVHPKLWNPKVVRMMTPTQRRMAGIPEETPRSYVTLNAKAARIANPKFLRTCR
jgi:hypothetical protein